MNRVVKHKNFSVCVSLHIYDVSRPNYKVGNRRLLSRSATRGPARISGGNTDRGLAAAGRVPSASPGSAHLTDKWHN